MKFLIIGAGAVGGYFGARLHQAGRDVTFLVRPGRAETLKQHGLKVLSPLGDFQIEPKLLLAKDLHEPYDVVLVALKAYALAAALDDFAPAVGAQSMVLPILNGMAHMDALSARFGTSLIGGAARIAVQLEAGMVRQLAPLHAITYGELDGARSERIENLDQAMRHANFDASLSTDIVQDMWEKWAFLACLGASTCLLQGPIGEIIASREGRATVEALIEECRLVAFASGQDLRPAAAQAMVTTLTAQGSTLTSSMYRDMRADAPVEAEEILADLVRRGGQAGVKTPLLQAATGRMRVYEARRNG